MPSIGGRVTRSGAQLPAPDLVTLPRHDQREREDQEERSGGGCTHLNDCRQKQAATKAIRSVQKQQQEQDNQQQQAIKIKNKDQKPSQEQDQKQDQEPRATTNNDGEQTCGALDLEAATATAEHDRSDWS